MDHCLTPRNPVHPPMLVPVAFKEPYDNGPFLTYPQRKGWSNEDLFNCNLKEGGVSRPSRFSGAEITGFIQRWLFLGFIAEFFVEPVDVAEFVQTIDGKSYLDSSSLPGRLTRLISREAATDAESRVERAKHIDRCLGRADLTLTYLGPIQRKFDTLCPKTLVCLSLLNEYILFSGYRIYGALGLSTVTKGQYNLLEAGMLADGWCPTELQFLKGRLSVHGMYFASNLVRPSPELDHTACVEDQCFARHFSEEDYETRHVNQNCNCAFASIDPAMMYPILSGCTIPLIVPTISNPPERRFGLADFSNVGGTARKYVAISHVWSDGLGNTRRNALPECQLLRLTDLAYEAYCGTGAPQNTPLWIDTICVPRGHPEAHDLAIALMVLTFAQAGGVLVLDAGLMGVKMEGMTEEEALLTVVCSAWTTRMWCLQEGWLASKIRIQFSDAAFDFSEALLRVNTANRDGMGEVMHSDIQGIFAGFAPGPPLSDIRMENPVLSVAAMMRGRKTSVQEDEAVCLASLLELDTQSVVQKTGAGERMAEFWRLVGKIPGEIVFAHGERLKIPGYRWAPASFLGTGVFGIPRSRQNEGLGMRIERGLVVQYPGWLFERDVCENPREAKSFMFTDGPSWWTVERIHPLPLGPKEMADVYDPIGYGLIFHFPMPQVSHVHAERDQNVGVVWDAVFVSVLSLMSDFGTVFARWEYNVLIKLSTLHNSNQVKEYLKEEEPQMFGLSLPGTQKWCVD